MQIQTDQLCLVHRAEGLCDRSVADIDISLDRQSWGGGGFEGFYLSCIVYSVHAAVNYCLYQWNFICLYHM